MTGWRGLACVLGAVGALAACQPLPELEAGVCGNHVIEAGEDCDGFAEAAQVCRPPDASNPCHYDCSLDAQGERIACPAGFGCDEEGICRRPTLAFTSAPRPAVPGAVELLMSADFDGDRRMDVLALEPARALGLRKSSLHFFDSAGSQRASWSTSVELGSPIVDDVSEDGHDDLVFSVGGLVVMQGESNQTLTPLPRASYYLEDSRIHTIPVADGLLHGTTPIVLLHQTDSGLLLKRPDELNQLKQLAELEGSLDDLIGEPVGGDVFEDQEDFPCFDVSFALRGSPTLGVYQACRRDADSGEVVWRDEAVVTTLRFDPPSTPVSAPSFADLDGDGHLDVLCTAVDGLYAAFGDGKKLGPLEPFALLLDGEGERVAAPHPLAAGDFSGDGIADLILPEVVLVSVKRGERIAYAGVFEATGRPWTLARVADLNADGKLDAIAASITHPDIDFLAGTGRGAPNPFVIHTVHPVNRLTVGDFDGDQIDDLAFVEPLGGPLPASHAVKAGTLSASPRHDQMSVAFGNPVGAPSAPVPIGHLANITELTAISDGVSSRRSDLMVVQDVETTVPTPAGTSSESTAKAGAANNSSLSIILGNGDRTFHAPAIVSNFAVDGTLQGADALYVATGHFAGPGRLDVALLGATGRPDDDPLYSFWYLPDVRSQQTVVRLMPFPFQLPFEPLRAPRERAEAPLRMHSADFDGDGADELLLAGPAPDGTSCLVELTRYDEAADRFESVVALRVADGCGDQPLLQAGDFDDDGATDLAVLTGSNSGEGHLRMFWNDGSGQLAEDGELPFFADPEGEAIRAFVFFEELDGSPVRLAYATSSALRLFEMRPRRRVLASIGRFEPDARDGKVAGLFGGATSIVAGDLSGDRIADLVVADGGDIHVFKAQVER